jgi:hypothetical protein
LLEGEEERTEDDGAEDDQPRRPRR